MFKDAKSLRVIGRLDTSVGPIFTIGKYEISFKRKPGRRLIACTCPNGSNNLPTALCKHKIKAIVTEYCLQNNLVLMPLEKK